MPAATYPEARTNLIAAASALQTSLTTLAVRTVQLENARDAFLLADPVADQAGFDAAASNLKLRRTQYNTAHQAVQLARSQLEEAREDCARLAT